MKIVYIVIGFFAFFCSCSSDFLDAKPDKDLVVPKTLADFQALLDDVNQQINQTPGGSDIATDDILLKENGLASASEEVRHIYLWNRDGIKNLIRNSDWDNMYAQILRSNIVLEGLEDLTELKDNLQFKEIKGAGLFFRAWHFFHLLQQFSKPYDVETAKSDPGIVLKLQADINEQRGISSVENCYSQILHDLEEAVKLLPKTSQVVSRPNLTSAYALLARVYLSRFDYDNALKYANLSLQLNANLMNFNSITTSFPDLFKQKNPEVIFYAIPILKTPIFTQNGIINKELINLYSTTDLRREKFFKFDAAENAQIKTSYYVNGLAYTFAGLLTTEQYLIKAECLIRKNAFEEGIVLINQLRKFRMSDKVPFIDLTAGNKEEALSIVLEERRRELFMKGLRWFDLRRLNKDDLFKRTLKRTYNGNEYQLGPTDEFYAFPVPTTELQYNPKIE